MKIAFITLFAFLAVFNVEGQGNRQVCKCEDNGVSFINPKLIKAVQFYRPTVLCPRLEIVVTTRDSMKCVNPESPFVKKLLRAIRRPEKKAVSTSMPPHTVHSTTLNNNQTVL